MGVNPLCNSHETGFLKLPFGTVTIYLYFKCHRLLKKTILHTVDIWAEMLLSLFTGILPLATMAPLQWLECSGLLLHALATSLTLNWYHKIRECASEFRCDCKKIPYCAEVCQSLDRLKMRYDESALFFIFKELTLNCRFCPDLMLRSELCNYFKLSW